MRIYTRTGDTGDTGLFGGGRVAKNHPRVEAYGEVDELNAVVGFARSIALMPHVDEVLVPIQRDLFAIGALLATPDREKMQSHLEKARSTTTGSTLRCHRRCPNRDEPSSLFAPGDSPACSRCARFAVAPSAVVSLVRPEIPGVVVIYLTGCRTALHASAPPVRAGING